MREPCRPADRPGAVRRAASLGPLGVGLSLLLSLATPGGSGGPALAATPEPPEQFGRWEQRLRHCRIERWAAPGPAAGPAAAAADAPAAVERCQRLRLDQQIAGLLVVRWLGGQVRGSVTGRQLTFAGMLDRSSPPMRCNADGGCRPDGRMALWVSAVATAGFGPGFQSGLLPATRLARGLCRLEPRRVLCEATETDGSRWRAEGRH